VVRAGRYAGQAALDLGEVVGEVVGDCRRALWGVQALPSAYRGVPSHASQVSAISRTVATAVGISVDGSRSSVGTGSAAAEEGSRVRYRTMRSTLRRGRFGGRRSGRRCGGDISVAAEVCRA